MVFTSLTASPPNFKTTYLDCAISAKQCHRQYSAFSVCFDRATHSAISDRYHRDITVWYIAHDMFRISPLWYTLWYRVHSKLCDITNIPRLDCVHRPVCLLINHPAAQHLNWRYNNIQTHTCYCESGILCNQSIDFQICLPLPRQKKVLQAERVLDSSLSWSMSCCI